MKYYLFAKFFRHLDAAALMDHCAQLGVDGPTALIREGYWVRPDHLSTDLPAFVRSAQDRGLEVKYADTSFEPENMAAYDEDIRVLRDCGITQFRLWYLFKKDAGHPRGMQDRMRSCVEKACEMAAKANIQAIVQIHGMMYPHNASTAYPLVKGLDPKHIGIKIDLGNNYSQEGYEFPEYQIPLLGEYAAAIGVKDGAFLRSSDPEAPDKGWRGHFLPAYEGQADYGKIFRLLCAEGFSGPAILMPFYDENDFDILFAKAKKEINYLKEKEREAWLSGTP